MAVRIVTDSTSDMSPNLARELGVSVVPLSVIFGDETYKEGVQIGHDLFYDKLVRSKVLPTTSAPSPGDFLQAYEPLLSDGADIVSIHISGKLSATGNATGGGTAGGPGRADRGDRFAAGIARHELPCLRCGKGGCRRRRRR